MNPEQFIDTLDPKWRDEFRSVYRFMLERIPAGYECVVQRNMVVFQVPLKDYPDTYNRQPLFLAGLASGKTNISLHLLPIYGNQQAYDRLVQVHAAAGKKLNVGKGCIRFKRASDLELDAIGEILNMPMTKWIETVKVLWHR